MPCETSTSPCVSFQEQIHEEPNATRPAVSPIRSILKNKQQLSNLLKMANDKMLRELEQCVEERDRLRASIRASPIDLSRLSPRTQSANRLYRDHMVGEIEQVSALIEDKYELLRQTLRDEDKPEWMLSEDSATFTLVGHKKPTQLKLFRRQSSLFFFQKQQVDKTPRGSTGGMTTAYERASNLERLRCQLTSRESEAQLGSGLLERISQRLAIH